MPVLWTSFERPIPLPRLLDPVADVFAGVLEANDIHWSALSEPEQRNVALQLLGQARLLWVWDNVEGVAGFPPGAASAWTADEQGELRAFLGPLVRATKARVLLTSRRPEHELARGLASRVELAPDAHARAGGAGPGRWPTATGGGWGSWRTGGPCCATPRATPSPPPWW